MKCENVSQSVRFFLFLMFLVLNVKVINLSPMKPCNNSCLTCQHTLYYLKMRGSANCKFSQCPDQCLLISSQWGNDRNSYFNYFKENQINICETCFRAGHCHINDCLAEKAIVHDAIDASLKTLHLHYLNENNSNFQLINNKSNHFLRNISFVLRSLKKIERVVKKYALLYKNSIKMKVYYKKAILQLSKQQNLTISDFNLGIGIDLDEDINTKDFSDKLKAIFDLHSLIKKDNIHFNDDQIYISTEIDHDKDIVKKMTDFSTKVKSFIQESSRIKSLFKSKILNNIRDNEKLSRVLEVLTSDKSLEEKMSLITEKHVAENIDILDEKPKKKTSPIPKSSETNIDKKDFKKNLKLNEKKEAKDVNKAETEQSKKKPRKSKKSALRKSKNKKAKIGNKGEKKSKSKKAKETKKQKSDDKLVLLPFRKSSLSGNSTLSFPKKTKEEIKNEIKILKKKQKNQMALEQLLKTYFEKQKKIITGLPKDSTIELPTKADKMSPTMKKQINRKKKPQSKASKAKSAGNVFSIPKKSDLTKEINMNLINSSNPPKIEEKPSKPTKKKSSKKKNKLRSTQQIFTETRNLIKKYTKKLFSRKKVKRHPKKNKSKEVKSHNEKPIPSLVFDVPNSRHLNRKSLNEIKSSVKTFFSRMTKKLEEHKSTPKKNSTPSNIKQSLHKSLETQSKKKLGKVEEFKKKNVEEKLKNLDQKFFRIKNKIILSLLN